MRDEHARTAPSTKPAPINDTLASGGNDNFYALWEMLHEDQAWRRHARCLHADADLFHPNKGCSPEPAKAICNGIEGQEPCPVREECLEWAMKTGEVHGVWGGKSKEERRRLRKQRRAG